ncbi:nuclear transport factor 2 family protein [Gordonia sp. DT30]|uniref:nuclear transport factor 2 family protein n=1 Tax=unclassified Gordonia (in: high G+C Gram-positive bacteria) TaxID=2657482 RepID=UPI003CEEAB44
MCEMFTRMVEAKDLSLVETYYDPDFELHTNGQVQDYQAFHDGHARVYPTAISYSVRYDDEAWVEGDGRLGGRVWITTERPGEPASEIEVIFLATFRDGRIHRLWELTWPDWSSLKAFDSYAD